MSGKRTSPAKLAEPSTLDGPSSRGVAWPDTRVPPSPRSGRGSGTLPQIIADELGADWRTVAVEAAPFNPLYANVLGARDLFELPAGGVLADWGDAHAARIGLMLTAGSSSVRAFEQPLRRALECEGLKTTTRIMHVLAWLLNHRAFLAGQMTDAQWKRHAILPPDRAPSAEMMDLLNLHTQALVAQTQRLHARVARLDREYRARRLAPYRSGEPSIGTINQRLDRHFVPG